MWTLYTPPPIPISLTLALSLSRHALPRLSPSHPTTHVLSRPHHSHYMALLNFSLHACTAIYNTPELGSDDTHPTNSRYVHPSHIFIHAAQPFILLWAYVWTNPNAPHLDTWYLPSHQITTAHFGIGSEQIRGYDVSFMSPHFLSNSTPQLVWWHTILFYCSLNPDPGY